MLGDAVFTTLVPVTDLARARRFYGDVLGLREADATPFSATYETGAGSRLTVHRRESASDGAIGVFDVSDLAGLVERLRGRGVAFERYDTPTTRTINFIAEDGPTRHAWFRDPDGNVFELTERGWTGAMDRTG